MERQHSGIRIIRLIAYLLLVNLAAGGLAVVFRYPSLWGTSSVFSEYALPLPNSWAFAHWPSMIFLAVCVDRAASFSKGRRKTYHAALGLGVILCIAFEFIYGEGDWHGIPFLLFLLVDLSCAGLFSMVNSRRSAGIAVALSSVMGAAFFLGPVLKDILEERGRQAALARVMGEAGWVRSVGIQVESDRTVYAVSLTDAADPLDEEGLCRDALSAYERMLAIRDPDKGTWPLLRVFRGDGFEAQLLGEASYSTRGRWLCRIENPGQGAPVERASAD